VAQQDRHVVGVAPVKIEWEAAGRRLAGPVAAQIGGNEAVMGLQAVHERTQVGAGCACETVNEEQRPSAADIFIRQGGAIG